MDGLFSTEWKARETALSLISREAISLLLSQMATHQMEASLRGSEAKETRVAVVQCVCMEVVRQSCGDSVLKIFLASLVSIICLDGPMARRVGTMERKCYSNVMDAE